MDFEVLQKTKRRQNPEDEYCRKGLVLISLQLIISTVRIIGGALLLSLSLSLSL